jgi:hypothetical protein
VPALVRREGVVGRREQGENPAEGEPRIYVRVEEDNRFPRSVAPFGIVQPRARREAPRGELHAVRLVHRFVSFPRPTPTRGRSRRASMMPPGEARCICLAK